MDIKIERYYTKLKNGATITRHREIILREEQDTDLGLTDEIWLDEN